MSDLIKTQVTQIVLKEDSKEVFIPKELPISERSREIYCASRNYPVIGSLEDMNSIVPRIHELINATIFDKGVAMDKKDISMLKLRVTKDILTTFKHFTLEEVRLAFHYGVRGELGEYFGINPTSFYQWLQNYKFDLSSQVTREVSKFLPKPDSLEKKMSKEEVNMSMTERICDLYATLREKGTYDFYDYGNIHYKFLEKLGIINLTVEQKLELIGRSREMFKATINNKQRNIIRLGKEYQKLNLPRVYEQIKEQSNPTFEEQIRVSAMRLALLDALQEMKEQEIDLAALIEEKTKLNNEENKDTNDSD